MNWCTNLIVAYIILGPGCYQQQLQCPNANINFWLYTRANQDSPHQLLAYDPNSIRSAPFVKNAPIKILIHGFLGDRDSTPNSQLRPEYLKGFDYNIISVDYNALARLPRYRAAARSTELVGMCTAQLVDVLVQNHGFHLSLIHPIGFSLGGHAVGFLGNYLKSGRFERITGLDVALPLFVTGDIHQKLDASDAKFVDVVHTNALMSGKFERSGTVDFFGNNGIHQPGCTFIKSMTSCNHIRAAEYFAESINTNVGFYALECTTWIGYMTGLCKLFDTFKQKILFGEHVSHNSQGLYFFPTYSKPPYARGKLRALALCSDHQKENGRTEEKKKIEDLTNKSSEESEEDSEEMEEIVVW